MQMMARASRTSRPATISALADLDSEYLMNLAESNVYAPFFPYRYTRTFLCIQWSPFFFETIYLHLPHSFLTKPPIISSALPHPFHAQSNFPAPIRPRPMRHPASNDCGISNSTLGQGLNCEKCFSGEEVSRHVLQLEER